jgi:methyl-accepting chemotaxis protein
MTDIVGAVRRLTDLIGEISVATGAQASEIQQVNAAVGHLDGMTQQNAALVEQSAAAAQSLKDQAGRLVDAVNAFKLPVMR